MTEPACDSSHIMCWPQTGQAYLNSLMAAAQRFHIWVTWATHFLHRIVTKFTRVLAYGHPTSLRYGATGQAANEDGERISRRNDRLSGLQAMCCGWDSRAPNSSQNVTVLGDATFKDLGHCCEASRMPLTAAQFDLVATANFLHKRPYRMIGFRQLW